MTVVKGFGINGKSSYVNVCKPCVVHTQFTVTPTDGLGVTSLKSNGYVRNVFMHTSTTPSANDGVTNPNPLAGFAQVQLTNNFNYFLGGFASVTPPVTGSIKIDNSALTAGQLYVISTLGDATLAKWQAVGVPQGVTPAVGVSFIALTNGGAGNVLTSRVSTPSVSGIQSVEFVGVASTMIANSSASVYGGAYIFAQFLGGAFTGSAMGTHTHDFTVIGGQAASTTNDIAAYAGPLIGKEQATNATFVGANSATNGGVVAVTAGTPAGTIASALVTPAAGSVVEMTLFFDGSSVTVDGL